MPADFAAIFAALRPLLAQHAESFTVQADTPEGYSVLSRIPSPFPRHKGQPLFFGGVRTGRAYVSFHLMPVYMCPELILKISPALKKRMQGKSCFNFRTPPEPALLADLKNLTEASVAAWRHNRWL